MSALAELALVPLRRRDDRQLLHSPLEQAARVDRATESSEGAQDLGTQGHRLEHLDRRLAALPQATTLIEGRVVLDRLEGRPYLFVRDGHAHQTPPVPFDKSGGSHP